LGQESAAASSTHLVLIALADSRVAGTRSLPVRPWFDGWKASQNVGTEELTAKRICQLAHAGDALALRAVAREAFYLGIGLANLVNLFAPDAVILSGSVMKSADMFLDGIREAMRRGCRFVPLEKIELTLASLGDDANPIGGGRVWHERFNQHDKYLCPST